MTYAIFNDEGFCQELDAQSKDEAYLEFLNSEWANDSYAYIEICCENHPEQAKITCEICNEENNE